MTSQTTNTSIQLLQTKKLSGASRLGSVPKDWAIRRLKNICKFEYGDTLSEEARTPKGVPVYGSNGLIGHTSAPNTKSECVIIGRKGSAGKVLYSKTPAFAIDTTFLVDSENTKANIKWLYYLLTSLKLETLSGDVGIPGLNRANTYEQRCFYPSPDDQSTIVRYLDHADQQIQAYIAAKQRLITLLEEERQAIIHQAVTRGLDPNVKLRPSGVEWLGDVPEHWEIRRLKSLVSIQTGGQDTINRKDDGKYPFFVRSQTVEKIDTWSYDGEAVLTAGDGAGVGKVFHYFNGKFDFHQRVYKFSDFTNILGKLFFHSFKANLHQVVLQGTAKSTVDSLRLPMLQNFPIPVPPMHQQAAIVDFSDKNSANIDISIDLARRQIELLQEYRTRLIADVVTGKLDVRKAAAELPDLEPVETTD